MGVVIDPEGHLGGLFLGYIFDFIRKSIDEEYGKALEVMQNDEGGVWLDE